MCYDHKKEQADKEHYRKCFNDNTDWNKPVSQLLEEIRNDFAKARRKLHDITGVLDGKIELNTLKVYLLVA